jgi:tetratricopeptide (TPR) repeat protein/tRNA A-37 threonylcarbamoyl transferase component Bud32
MRIILFIPAFFSLFQSAAHATNDPHDTPQVAEVSVMDKSVQQAFKTKKQIDDLMGKLKDTAYYNSLSLEDRQKNLDQVSRLITSLGASSGNDAVFHLLKAERETIQEMQQQLQTEKATQQQSQQASTGQQSGGTVQEQSATQNTSPATDIQTQAGFANNVENLFHGEMKNLSPNDSSVFAGSGEAYLRQRNYRGAFQDFGRAIKLGLLTPQTWTGYGTAAYHLGDTKLAAQSGASALELNPSYSPAIALLKLSANRAPSLTLPNVQDANGKPGDLTMTPNAGSDNQPHAMGDSFNSMSPAEIAAAAQRLANAPPSAVSQSAAITQQAAAAMAVHDFSKAQDLLTQAVALNGRNAEAYNDRAIAENKLGNYKGAINDASFALGLVPGSAAALQTRSWAFAQDGQYKEALADANFSLERDPSNAYAYYNRAFALAGSQDHDGALDSLKKAADLDHRFQQTYQQALEAPKDADLVFLFADVGTKKASPAGAAPAPGSRQKRFAHIMLISVLGGGLVALGLLHIFSARWRQTVHATLRRFTGAAPGEGPAENADGFWSGYTVTREIGSGGMGIVYEATDNALARRVAIKKMRDEVRADAEERRRFLAEARTVATLHHPNIVDIYSIVEDSGDIYLVFEYVDGRTVHQHLGERGPLALADAKRIMKEACDAVSYAQQQGVIHRDLKTSNIMLAANGQVKVMDFGVARQAQEALSKVAQTNTIVGTPPYMAPEQEQGTVRRESDVFALGVCFYEMLSGRLPFPGQGGGMLLNKINGKHILLSQVVPGLPAGIDEVVAKALAPDPEQRYRTPSELSAAVQGLPG